MPSTDTPRVRDALTTDALNSLVHQFSDALCFYRELIQNSLDAQSRTIQVDVRWDDGMTTISVSDQGEGMNRDVIETELTRLFSSSKENDLTKIGKFGVGFVSVFALDPHAVVVDTSRDGENWRVLFHPDKSYTLVKMEQPVGGTVVRLIKPMSRLEFEKLERRSEEILSYWCKYSEAAISYQGRPVNRDFDLDSPVKVHYKDKMGTQVVAALTADVTPFYGFYNRGLTLIEGRQSFFPQVAFRLKSHWLEHTISRDNVMQDQNFRKALAVVREAVYGKLYPALVERLQKGESELMAYVPGLLRDASQRPPGIMDAEIFPVLGGGLVSAKHLAWARRKRGAVYYAHPPDAMADAILQKGFPVLSGDHLEVLEPAVRSAVGEAPVEAGHTLYLPKVIHSLPPEWRRLLKKLNALVYKARLPIRRVLLGDFDYPGSCVRDELAVLCLGLKAPNHGPPLRLPLPDGHKAFLLVNRVHPIAHEALRAAVEDAGVAAHGLFLLLSLGGVLPPPSSEVTLRQSLRQR